MGRNVVLIHESEIVAKGLRSILLSNFNMDLIHLNSIVDFTARKYLSDCYTLFIIDKDLKDDNLIKKLGCIKERNKLDILWFYNFDVEGENSLNIYSSTNSIIKVIRELLMKEGGYKDLAPQGLSERELDVLRLVAKGKSNKDIADMLFISIHTVISHRKNITDKLGIKSIPGLTVYAILNKLVEPSEIS